MSSGGGGAGGSGGGGVATASSATAMKRSDEARVQMRQQQARGAKEVAKLTGENSHPDQKTQDVCGVQQRQQQQQQVSKLVFGLNPRAHRQKPAGAQQSQRSCPDHSVAAGGVVQGGDKQAETRIGSAQAPVRKSTGPRASKYGNYYKPQDLTSQQFEPISSANKMTKSANSDTPTTRGSSEGLNTSSGSSGRLAVDGGGATGRSSSSSSSRQSPGRSTSSSSASSSRRKSFDEDISTLKLESNAADLQQQPILKTRTQFNILPPPQLSIATTGTGSVVNYAKSRIYDRPVKRILANPPEETYSILDDRSGQIPLSILSGFKPPKQVNVAKARKKWEGGEPFAKCKSRKRLAAQAQKKLFPGTWSMTSVVATQQLHLQQALAQSAGTASLRSKPTLETDPSVKVLTRGSVLERVQQFEKVPSTGTRALSGLSLPGSDDDDDDDDGEDDDNDEESQDSSAALPSTSSSMGNAGGQLSRSSSVSSRTSVSSLGSDGGETVMQQVPTAGQAPASKTPAASTPKQAQGASPAATATNVHATRRLSLRRRSSLGLRRGSTENLIPKFYHPNGKPNTYEIEIQKRNIVACFDKFPDRRAQLAQTGPGLALARKQFHQISLACGYSEYFKVPLQRFISHKLQTDPKLIQMVSASNQAVSRQRKSSTIALNTNGSSSLLTRPLVKAASLDTTRDLQANNKRHNTPSAKSPGAANVQADDDKKGLAESVSCDEFLACWRDLISQAYDNAAQFIHLLTLGQRNALVPDDFVPLVQSIIDDHPGLKFLRAAPDFHMRYIQTVIARIYFNINRSWTGKLSLQELRKSNLLSVLQALAQEEDINKIRNYFSYEHFYVIYCKFWNLDQDHDLFISKEDLARHNDAAISSRIIERIFSGIVSKQIAKTGRMSYADFVWFLIAEEDKKHPRSVEYWFRLMDIDGDGYISMYEMEYFYYEQTKRLELMNIEALPFLDSACQILDLVNPREKNKISLADLKRTKMATIFFDTFINLEKYLEHESREFVSTRDIIQNGIVISDWDRYASEEYENLVSEESSV